MNIRPMILLSLAAIAAMTGIALAALHYLPNGAMLPIHWNARGEVDRLAPAIQALFLPAGIAAFAALLMGVIPAIEPLQEKLAQSAGFYRIAWGAMLAIILLCQIMIAAPAFGWSISGTVPIIAAGLLLIVLGNYLPKTRPSFFVGIRTPWTLTDPENWIATHRLGGRTMLLAGLLLLLSSLLPPMFRVVLICGAVILGALVPIIFSYMFWRRRKLRSSHGR